MIVVGYNYEGKPISIVNAKSKELAMAYWHGAGILPHSTKTEDDFDYESNGTGVVPILKTKEIGTFNLKQDLNTKILTIIQ